MSGKPVPLVINTQGWVKGLGVPILMELIKYTSPSVLAQIQSDKGASQKSSTTKLHVRAMSSQQALSTRCSFRLNVIVFDFVSSFTRTLHGAYAGCG